MNYTIREKAIEIFKQQKSKITKGQTEDKDGFLALQEQYMLKLAYYTSLKLKLWGNERYYDTQVGNFQLKKMLYFLKGTVASRKFHSVI